MFAFNFLLILSVLLFIGQETLAIPGGINEMTETDTVKEIAQWTIDKIGQYTGIPGTYTVNSIKNIQAQVVSGIIFKCFYLN